MTIENNPKRLQNGIDGTRLKAGCCVLGSDLERGHPEECGRKPWEQVDLPLDEDAIGDQLRDPDERDRDERLDQSQHQGQGCAMVSGCETSLAAATTTRALGKTHGSEGGW